MKEMKKITQGIKEMAKLGFIQIDEEEKYSARRFIKYDDDGRITNSINYIYTEGIGLQVFANNLKYGYGSRMDGDLLNAIKLNFDELKGETK